MGAKLNLKAYGLDQKNTRGIVRGFCDPFADDLIDKNIRFVNCEQNSEIMSTLWPMKYN